jgi:hypothetical protein
MEDHSRSFEFELKTIGIAGAHDYREGMRRIAAPGLD